MTTITIPKTIEDAKASLGGITALLTAKEWERAAIVYAFTFEGTGGPSGNRNADENSSALPIDAFAKMGIAGLKSRDAVRLYRKAWQSAMQDGAPDVHPGDSIEMPNLPWKSAFGERTEDVQERVFRQVVRDPEAFAKAVEDPDVADLVAERTVKTPATRWRAEEAITEHRREEAAESHTTSPRPASVAVERVIKAVETFFDTPITHNGVAMTYRDVIRTVAETGDARELHRMSIVSTPLGPVLSEALAKMAVEATALSDLFLIESAKEIEA